MNKSLACPANVESLNAGRISRQVLTYELVARLTGVVRPSIGDFVRPIQQYCVEKELPALASESLVSNRVSLVSGS